MKPAQPDHRNALDGLEPPDQWDDILFRAARPDVALLPDVPARRSVRPLLTAAAAVVMVGLVAALVLGAGRGSDPKVGTLAGEPSSAGTVVGPDGKPDPADPAEPDGLATGASSTTVEGGRPGEVPSDVQEPGASTTPGNGTGSGGGSSPSGMGDNPTPGSVPSADPVVPVGPEGGGSAPGQATTTTLAPSPTTTPSPLSVKPAGMPWGRSWVLGSMTDTSGNRALATDRAIVLDATTEGTISISVCNRIGGTGNVVDGRLVLQMAASTEMACGQPLDGHETWLAQLLASSPTVNVTGDILVLSNGTQRAEFDVLRVSEGTPRESTPDATSETTKPNEVTKS